MSKLLQSHSEVDSYLSCPRRHYYAFGYPNSDGSFGLEPKSHSNGLYRGIKGHEALDLYYTALQNGSSLSDAEAEAKAYITKQISAEPERSDLLLELYLILDVYIAFYGEEDTKGWSYLAVEQTFEHNGFPFKPDLVRRNKRSGVVEVVDHKFLANLYGGDEIAIQPQLAKYVGTLREMGYEVKDGLYNMISTRVYKTKPYDPRFQLKRVRANLKPTRIETTLREHHEVSREIATLKLLSNDDWKRAARRHASSFNCKNCPFLGICVSELNGEDITVAVKYNFQPNSYGYTEDDIDVSSN